MTIKEFLIEAWTLSEELKEGLVKLEAIAADYETEEACIFSIITVHLQFHNLLLLYVCCSRVAFMNTLNFFP